MEERRAHASFCFESLAPLSQSSPSGCNSFTWINLGQHFLFIILCILTHFHDSTTKEGGTKEHRGMLCPLFAHSEQSEFAMECPLSSFDFNSCTSWMTNDKLNGRGMRLRWKWLWSGGVLGRSRRTECMNCRCVLFMAKTLVLTKAHAIEDWVFI